jgi:lipid II:glycine glycyltransferase (peptidoglycan interpeptide bridge formation enzyme)
MQWIDPLTDQRWARLVARHPQASVFHTCGWVEALHRTYGYEPVALVIEGSGGELASGMVFCRIRSWLTGARLVSLPFSDHADPLIESDVDRARLMDALCQPELLRRWKYVELRPSYRLAETDDGSLMANRYYLHCLDLRPCLDNLVAGFHKNHVVRKLRRGERENLIYEEGTSAFLLNAFYELLLMTRRRHRLPPQPLAWFESILECMPEQAKVRVAFKDGKAIAAIVTLRHRDTMVYKYGASDAAFHALGGMHMLFWKTIQEARGHGCTELDLGRSEVHNDGLVAFKDHWGAVRTPLVYWRHPAQKGADGVERLNGDLARRIFALVPDRLLIAAGKTLYRHIG